MKQLDQFRGCLIGGAAGDALGYAIEFNGINEIRRTYGEKGITSYHLRDGLARISDDTQMTMFTAAGLLAGEANGGAYLEGIAANYRDWLLTQYEPYPLPGGSHASWLINLPDLFHARAPGNTCMSAISAGCTGTMEHPVNHSRGCGGVMRVAPIGLYFVDRDVPIEAVDRLGAQAAALTHGHELGYLPAAVLVHLVHRLAFGAEDTVLAALKDAMDALPRVFPEAKEVARQNELLSMAIDFAGSDVSELDAIEALGGGWVGEEAIAIAAYCALKHENDFDTALIAAVNHSGDSDSTGAIAGNILGAKLGLAGIPAKYTEALELRDAILTLADDLFYGPDAKKEPLFARKYIHMTYSGK